MVYTADAPLAVVALAPDADGLRTGCRAGGARVPRRRDGRVGARSRRCPSPSRSRCARWPKAPSSAATTARRWRSGGLPRGVERFVICGGGDDLAPVADRAALIGRWTNAARELVDAPPNVVSPAGLAERAAALPGLRTEVIDAARGRARRAGRRRRQQPDRPAADRPPARAARRAGRTPARAGREVRHVRHRRLLPQAAVGHRPPEGRHGRRRRGRRGAGRDRRARAPAVGHGRRCPPARTC